MTSWVLRRLQQAGMALALAGLVVFVTEWAYPAGQLSIQVGSPHYTRIVADTVPYVTVAIAITNVGVNSVPVDGQHFLLEDDAGQRYEPDPSTGFIDAIHSSQMLLMARTFHATGVYRLRPGRTAAALVFVTPTGQAVRFRLK